MALIETNFIRPQEVYDRNTGESKVRYRSYDGNDRFIPVVDGEKGVPKTMVEVTHAELKAMRDGGKLTPGALYRITDYNCTTTQENTQSAGHQFDIVLLALSENKLAEEGWAMMHENDTYFANSNLSAWKVWYCLDNDKSRFAWADDSVDEGSPASFHCEPLRGSKITGDTYIRNIEIDTEINGQIFYGWTGEETSINCFTLTEEVQEEDELYVYNDRTGEMESDQNKPLGFAPAHEGTNLPNGRGVIYRLIDEWGNDVPWDYKNILFTINDKTTYSLSMAGRDSSDEFDATLNGGTLGVIVNTTHGESRDGRTPKSIYPISRVMLQQCLIYLNEDVSPDSYLFTNNGHANIIYGLEIYDPNA